MICEWVTNCLEQDAQKIIFESSHCLVRGEPQGTEHFSSLFLKERDSVGLYRVDEMEEYLSILFEERI